ncbi:tetratricopeptide repeat protein [Persephonella sp.]
MSLILETLSRLKKTGSKKSVPPGLKPKKEDKNSRRMIILASTAVMLSAVFAFLTVYNNRLLYEENNIITPLKTEKTSPPDNLYVKNAEPEISLQKEKKTVQIQEIKPKKNDIPADKAKTKTKREPVQTEPEKNKQQDDRIYLYTTYLSKANSYLDKGQLKKSLLFYEKAYSINPKEKLLKNIIVLKIMTGQVKNINRYIRKIKNDSYLADIILGIINAGHLSEAEKILKTALKSGKSPYMLYVYGILLEKKGLYKKAESVYKEAYSLEPEDPYIAYAYGRILEINGKYRNAVNVYKSILKMNSTDEKIGMVVRERLKILR